MKKILISGANGFIGKHLVEYFTKNNYFVYALVQENTDIDYISRFNNLQIIYFKLEEFSLLKDILPVGIDIFYHLAWHGVTTTLKNDEEIQLSNINYSLNALKVAKDLNIGKIIFTGSMSEYAYNPSKVTGEDAPTPADFYSASKVATHYICDTFARQHNLNFIWCLISSIYGPGREDNNLITYAIKSFLNKQIPEFTKLEQKWDYIYIDDLIRALYKVGKYKNNFSVYPIGSGENKKLSEYVKIIRNTIDENLHMNIGKLPYKTSKIDNSVVDISRLEKDMKFQPKVTFELGIKKTIEYFLNKENFKID